MSLDDAIRALAMTQRCVFTTEQARAIGATSAALHHRIRNGALVRIAPRVYCLGGVRLTTDLLLLASILECGGTCAISHETAAAHWRLPGFRIEPIQTLRFRDGEFRPMSLARRHTTTSFPDTQIAEADGLLITTPARTLFDLAPRLHPEKLERLVDTAWARQLVNWRVMHRTFRELERRGRPGTRVMRKLLDARPAEYVPPASGLESRFRWLLREDGQDEMERQINVGADDMWIGRVDFIDRTAKVIVEVQSDLHHTSISDCRADQSRRKALEDAGWAVTLISEWELWHCGREVRARVRAERRRR
jgi:very-short-patch-repair endonuclease